MFRKDSPNYPVIQYNYYTNLTVVHVSIRPERITGSYLTQVKNTPILCISELDVTEAVDRNSYYPNIEVSRCERVVGQW